MQVPTGIKVMDHMLLPALKRFGGAAVPPVQFPVRFGVILLFALLVLALPEDVRADKDLPGGTGEDAPAVSAAADGDGPAGEPGKPENKKRRRGRIELKRENTARGTEDESTKTSVKIYMYLTGVVSLFRVELPFPDEKTDFGGDPFTPRLGDIKVRFGFRDIPVHDMPISSFLEFTFPTAQPSSLGSGKYQFSPGVETLFPLAQFGQASKPHKVSLKTLLQQFVSLGGDKDRKDINYTKLEFTLRDTWRKYWASLLFKPALDWEQDAKTGAVGELEVGWNVDPDWSIALKGGGRLWGEGVPSTYSRRSTLTVNYFF